MVNQTFPVAPGVQVNVTPGQGQPPLPPFPQMQQPTGQVQALPSGEVAVATPQGSAFFTFTNLLVLAALGAGLYWAYKQGYLTELVEKVKEHL